MIKQKRQIKGKKEGWGDMCSMNVKQQTNIWHLLKLYLWI